MNKNEILATIEEEIGQKTDESMELESLGLDSLETLSLFTALDIPDDAIPDMHTVADIVRYLECH